MALTILQLTDTHFFADGQKTLHGINTRESFSAVLKAAQSEDVTPDIILLTGDLADRGEVEAYRALEQALAVFDCPIYALPGNHDDRENLKRAFDETRIYDDKRIEEKGWQCILLDSVIVGSDAGLLAETELDYLKIHLVLSPKLPTIVALHHHVKPVDSGMDTIMLENTDAFLNIINTHPNVKVVLSGHVHQAYDKTEQQIRYLTTPSTCYQMRSGVSGFDVAENDLPGCRFLQCTADGELTTWVTRSDNKLRE
jgi:3',5'-cyclic-AMP phosphodiesterase